MDSISTKRKVTNAMKKRVAGRQRYTCASNISGYKCPLNGLPFDESGYEIDHIIELRNGGTNDEINLQALCLMCHRVKTSRKSSELATVKNQYPNKISNNKNVTHRIRLDSGRHLIKYSDGTSTIE